MPRWKALPDELDPQVREFASQLRRLVDRSGLSIAAVSDRTGYSKTSWERYLNGRLLAPKGAIVALAEVTGTQPVHLITMWELAERAWSRSEMRHDMTMQAIRISQARAALGELGTQAAGGGPGGGSGGGGSPASGASGVSGAAPSSSTYGASSSYGDVSPSAFGAPGTGQQPSAGGSSPDGPRRRGKLTMILAGVVGVLVVVAAVVLMTGLGGGDDKNDDAAKPSVTPSKSDSKRPAGVECGGKDCAGKDPEAMGCGGGLARTTSRATVGKAQVEVRYSKACGAAWARITQATPGDELTITGSGGGASAKQGSKVNEDFDAYTPMVAAESGTAAKACATLTSGLNGCTE
ncbi:XRE family transcriptional regulator [Streptomyces sp. NPDC002564]|uniref:XRE family transcriptional regulator n=1 Tax=Streptomyces sp. NPDC002564 TaxID=3364649 RepID=UPI0036CC1F46